MNIVKCNDLGCTVDMDVQPSWLGVGTYYRFFVNNEVGPENACKAIVRAMQSVGLPASDPKPECDPKPVRVILNDPATIVMWSDGKKTVSKARGGDEYDPLFGLMACVVRRLTHNRAHSVDEYEDIIKSCVENHRTVDELRCLAKYLREYADIVDATANAVEIEGEDSFAKRKDVRVRWETAPWF